MKLLILTGLLYGSYKCFYILKLGLKRTCSQVIELFAYSEYSCSFVVLH